MKLNSKIILITGATKGIGKEMALQLLAKNNTVIVAARDEKALAEMKNGYPKIETLLFDALNDDHLLNAKNYIEKSFGKLDFLINNAAICNSYNFLEDETSFEKMDIELKTNINSPIKLTKTLLSLLQIPTEAGILNVTSGVAYLPMMSLPVYSATKAALRSFTLSLRERLLATNIKIFEALPPLVATQMTQNMIGKAQNMDKMSAADCAKSIINGIESNNYNINIGTSKSLFWGSRLLPKVVLKQLNKL